MDKEDEEYDRLISKASKIYDKNFSNQCFFERAIFLSWYCSKGDCRFCYMSTQKGKIKKVSSSLAKRRVESLITEAILCKELGWNIEFLSGGYDSYSDEELLDVVKKIYFAYGKRLWLNLGLLSKEQIELLKPYAEGICGSIECLDEKLHDELCPSKPLKPIIEMLDYAKKERLQTAITIIIGIGETIDDYALLKDFIEKHGIDRITFYALNPHKGTMFKKGPDKKYYAEWIALTRIDFPKIFIIAGSWVDRISELSLLLKAGANNITKFPAASLFNTRFSKEIEHQIRISGREFKGSLTRLPDIDWDEKIDELTSEVFDARLKSKIKIKMQSYLKMMKNADKKYSDKAGREIDE